MNNENNVDKKRKIRNTRSIDGEITGWANTFTSEPDPEDRDHDDMNPIMCGFNAHLADPNSTMRSFENLNQ